MTAPLASIAPAATPSWVSGTPRLRETKKLRPGGMGRGWNEQAKPFIWTANADEAFAKVRLVQTHVKKLVDHHAK